MGKGGCSLAYLEVDQQLGHTQIPAVLLLLVCHWDQIGVE
jgi:hypothetical protein